MSFSGEKTGNKCKAGEKSLQGVFYREVGGKRGALTNTKF